MSGLRESTAPWGDLADHGQANALVSADGAISYAELALRVRARARRFGSDRRLVVLRCRNDIETVVSYLAAFEGGHVVLPLPACADVDEVVATYAPDLVVDGDSIADLGRRSPDLHPDLALLLSTSGTTGSPKLVRLSRDNVRANARSIADYLHLGADDCAATTLPLHYCYGLSVLHSHLMVGASLLLTDASVVDDRFWELFDAVGATSFAGVPHTFDLLDRSGFSERALPSLRYVTQAGGRLAADAVRRYARLGATNGFDLVVMYGQTEATARMAFLPPDLAEARPDTIGVPVPGGDFRIDPATSELIYTGANVMMGYADRPADLALGGTLTELRTGDTAVQHPDGIYEITGRLKRVAKVFGLRLDLEQLERRHRVPMIEVDGQLCVFGASSRLAAQVAGECRLPAHAVRALWIEEVPLTSTGKTDYRALRELALAAATIERPGGHDVRALFAVVLGRPATWEDSFVSLGGDSLSYVEVSTRLGSMLGSVPDGWPTMTARELSVLRARRRFGVSVESSVVLRALAMLMIVASHANVFAVLGGAHVLLAVAGFNLARFQLADRPSRVRRLLSALRSVWVPAALWIGGVGLVVGAYDWSTAAMLNNLLGADRWDDQWQMWFIEAIVWALLGTTALVAVPVVDRLERRRPFLFALGLFGALMGLRLLTVGATADIPGRYSIPGVLAFVALGWLVARSRSLVERLIASAAAVLATYGFFDDLHREALVVAGVLVLLWVPSVRMPRPLSRLVSLVAGASMWIYLTHWQVYPHLEMTYPYLATLLSVVVGIAVWRGHEGVKGLRVAVRFRPSPARDLGSRI